MEVCRRSSWLLLLLGVSLLATTLQGVQGEVESEGPSESECRPYIEKALKELETGDSDTGTAETGDSIEDVSTVDITTDDSDHPAGDGDDDIHDEANETTESVEAEPAAADEQEETQEAASTEAGEPSAEEADTTKEEGSQEVEAGTESVEEDQKTDEVSQENSENAEKTESKEESTDAETDAQSLEETADETKESVETVEETDEEQQASVEEPAEEQEQADEAAPESAEAEQAESVESEAEQAESVETEAEQAESAEAEQAESVETEAEQAESAEAGQAESVEAEAEQAESVEAEAEQAEVEQAESAESEAEQAESVEAEAEQAESVETEAEQAESVEADAESAASTETEQAESVEDAQASQEEQTETQDDTTAEEQDAAESVETVEEKSAEKEDATEEQQADQPASTEEQAEETKETETTEETEEVKEQSVEETAEETESAGDTAEEGDSTASAEVGERAPVEDLTLDIEIPTELRERDHVERLLKVDEEASETEQVINRIAEITLRELKRLYENAIKPLEGLYKYRDLSNRHFGDSEIFSKPLILFMGPWSGGKSSIINYLLNNEYNETSLRTGAEPSPAYFNLLMHGEEPEIVDGTQLAADFTFAGLQKFGQGLEQHLRGVKLPSKLLEKVNIVEIPGILEVRKQVSRVFPFNDACQWFIDRADIIFLVYDPSKLDVGPETEAILDQLKGREHQTRIILNKADQVKPEELMRVQGALIWNISPLMSSPQPPVMYTTSLWSRPYETWAPTRLLQAQERAFLRDLRSAVDKRIENKIASARRFAVRVRNHAKMVDCYLTTYYNHKSVFGNRKQVADEIIEHPQDYHIYEGLSTLTNISRYDLPDPEVYKDFFKLNALYDFQQLSATCTYFRGCPINRLDVAIAYDLPELVGKHKRLVENALAEVNPAPVPGS